MPLLATLADIAALKETWQVECKLARGRDGHGALPEDIWETYSAFANTQGGNIFLGLRELGPGRYELAGISNPGKVIGELMTGADDPRKVSANILCIDSIEVVVIEGFSIIHINIPKAPINLRPVYIGNDPINGTFVRDRSSDVRLSEDRVRRMQARVRGKLLNKA